MRKAQQTRSLVAAWFDFLPPDDLATAQAIHKAIRGVEPDLTEAIRQGNLLLSLHGEPLLGIAPGHHHVQLLIFNGHELEPVLGPLDGVAKRQRQVRFPSGRPVDAAQVEMIARVSVEQARRHQSP